MAEFDNFDDELNRALQSLNAATLPAGMEARILARAEEEASIALKPVRTRRIQIIAWPVGAIAAVALVLAIAMGHHRNEVSLNRPGASTTPIPAQPKIPQPIRSQAPPQVAIAAIPKSERTLSADKALLRPHLPVAVLSGAATPQELLLFQIAAQSQTHPEAKELLDPEMRAKDLAQMKQEFADFLNSGNKTGDKTP